jgi:hypothetical protein
MVKLTPRVLTGSSPDGWVVEYETGDGVVCVPIHGRASMLVRENGCIEPHLGWPRPIYGELPFGADGSVAWSNGHSGWSLAGSGYVMHRRRRDGEVTVMDLPFRPTQGVWSRGCLYWTCFPSGVGYWTPGEEPRFLLPDLPLFAVCPDADALLLEPCVRDCDGQLQRRLLTEGWRWRIGSAPSRVQLGAFGAASDRSAGTRWTAVAHPEADVIALEASGGHRALLRCYYPSRLAWLGQSLLVSTVSGELLLFEQLAPVLDEWLARQGQPRP